ncbi:MAG: hypothetical protein RIE73_18195 [Coleofasciculus sp. C1-SOL-03]|uniref:hypothetical protein n=1 Tax=Coleofasciculus sp. C1-SOL-03 TaxID=3069522 RepID=UPI0032FF5E69
MTTTKEQLLIAIESTPEPILAQILDYLEYLKTKPTRPTARSRTVPIPDGEPLKRGSQAISPRCNFWSITPLACHF